MIRYVFVYGTLKRGFGNNAVLRDSRFVDTGVTLAKCRLYHAGFPVLRPRSKRPSAFNLPVAGEVFEVTDPAVWHMLDSLESEGRMYDRKIKLIRLSGGGVIKAYAYVGVWECWRRRISTGILYATQNGQYKWPAQTLDQILCSAA